MLSYVTVSLGLGLLYIVYFDILIRLGVDHPRDKQSDRCTEVC